MATHNLLLRLGDTMFLEVIAPNRAVPSPSRPRWFALDSLTSHSSPSLSTWVVRTPDIRAAVTASSEPLGNIEPMSRGALDWLITIPADGSVPLDGVAPALIEWHTDVHPATKLEDSGLALTKLEIIHPTPNRVSRLLSSLDLDAPVSVLPAVPGASARGCAHQDTAGTSNPICPLEPIITTELIAASRTRPVNSAITNFFNSRERVRKRTPSGLSRENMPLTARSMTTSLPCATLLPIRLLQRPRANKRHQTAGTASAVLSACYKFIFCLDKGGLCRLSNLDESKCYRKHNISRDTLSLI